MDPILTKCIKCGADKVKADECPSCGVIYAKAEGAFLDKIKEGIRKEETEHPKESEKEEAKKSTDEKKWQQTNDELKAKNNKIPKFHIWIPAAFLLSILILYWLADSGNKDSNNLIISGDSPAVTKTWAPEPIKKTDMWVSTTDALSSSSCIVLLNKIYNEYNSRPDMRTCFYRGASYVLCETTGGLVISHECKGRYIETIEER